MVITSIEEKVRQYFKLKQESWGRNGKNILRRGVFWIDPDRTDFLFAIYSDDNLWTAFFEYEILYRSDRCKFGRIEYKKMRTLMHQQFKKELKIDGNKYISDDDLIWVGSEAIWSLILDFVNFMPPIHKALSKNISDDLRN